MASDPELPPRVSARIVATATELGFTRPPVALRIKLVQNANDWSLFVHTNPPSAAPGVVEWIAQYAPKRVEFGARHVLRADFERPPEAWAQMFRDVELEMLDLEADGQAVATISGQRGALAAFVRRAGGPARPDIRHVGKTVPKESFLTQAQDDALRSAVKSGYYLVPRKLNLKQLAKQLGISSASLSERLRRAEGRILTQYVNDDHAATHEEAPHFETRSLRPSAPEAKRPPTPPL